MRLALIDKEWVVIEPFSPKGGRGLRRVDDRRILNGTFRIPHSVAPRRDLPDRYGARTTVYNRYLRWALCGQTVEPVVGGMKDKQGADAFIMRRGDERERDCSTGNEPTALYHYFAYLRK